MSWEYMALKFKENPLNTCPACGAHFEPFMRGNVSNAWRGLFAVFGTPYVCVICRACKEIVGHEHPANNNITLKRKYR